MPESKSSLKEAQRLYEAGNEHYSNRDYGKAIEQYNKALEKNPEHEGALFRLGNAHYYSGNHEKAIESFRKLLEINPDDLRALLNMADILNTNPGSTRKDFSEAIKIYRKALGNPRYRGDKKISEKLETAIFRRDMH